MLIIKICTGMWKNANRDERELLVCKELGMDVLVMAKGQPKEKPKKDNVNGFEVIRLSTRPLGANFPVLINRVLSIIIWANYAKKMDAKILSCHSINALLIGYVSNIFRRKNKKAKLIYDSHEFELGRATQRSKLTTWGLKNLERFLIKRCAFSIMVNDSIADEVQKIHKLKQRPIVVRNTPTYWVLDHNKIEEKRKDICNALGLSYDTFFIMYHGYITPQRNIEVVIDAVSRNKEIAAIILGDSSPENFVIELKKRVEKLGITNRVFFHPAVPIDDLYKYIGVANVGTVFLTSNYKNEYFALPNKFLENIQAEIPILTFKFPEMKRIIDQYDIGIAINEDIKDIDFAIEKFRNDKKFYVKCKNNLIKAKQDLCWENEKQVLINAYKILEMK